MWYDIKSFDVFCLGSDKPSSVHVSTVQDMASMRHFRSVARIGLKGGSRSGHEPLGLARGRGTVFALPKD